VKVLRWLGVLGCVCLLAIPAQAQVTISQNFSVYPPPGGGTFYTEYGSGTGTVMNDGPAGVDQNYYRLTASQNSTLNQIVFDLPSPTGPVSSVTGSFDFRCGQTIGTHADGIGVALLPTSVYGQVGNGVSGATALPQITEEGSGNFDGSIGFGLDTYNNGAPFDVGNPNLPQGSDASEVSVGYTSVSPRSGFVYAVDLYSLTIGGLTNAYNLHNDNMADDSAFDNCSFSVSISPSGGATVTIQITSNQNPASSSALDANPTTTLPPGTTFTAISASIPGVTPYEMRIGFGGRTGGANDTNDIANINVTFTP
jgi:Bacterial lectin